MTMVEIIKNVWDHNFNPVLAQMAMCMFALIIGGTKNILMEILKINPLKKSGVILKQEIV